MNVKQDEAWEREPFLRLLYDEYVLCRNVEIVVYRRPDGKKEEKLIRGRWTTGLNLLPQAGGVEDQNFVLMRVFAAFLAGEQQGQQRMMDK